MKTRSLLSAVAVCCLLPGCATVGPEQSCAEDTCKIFVSVGANCEITPGPTDNLVVARGNAPFIVWELDNAAYNDGGWRFPGGENSINFKTGTGGEINFVSHSPRVVLFQNLHTKAGKYQYGINLVNKDKTKTCRQDPWIVNQ